MALACSTTALVAQSTLGSFAERQRKQLSLRGQQIEQQLSEARQNYATLPSDSLAQLIHELEKQSDAIKAALVRLAPQEEPEATPVPVVAPTTTPTDNDTPATEDMAEEIIDEEPTPVTPTEEAPMPTEEPIVPDTLTTADPTPSETTIVVNEELKSLFVTSMRRYKLIEDEITGLIKEYNCQYDTASLNRREYDKATSLQQLDTHYAAYQKALEECRGLANRIVERGDILFESKEKSLMGFADSVGLSSIATQHTILAEDMEGKMIEKLSGNCTDTDLALYPYRLKSTIELEQTIAQHIAPEEVAELDKQLASIDSTQTLYAPIDEPERSNAKFAAVKVDKRTKHKAVSALPQLKIPSKGELYSITVANYASLPTSTSVFRNATPLYRERREDGRTYIYLGLYPTARSAQDDIAYLRKIGFKQPTLVMWRDGIRRDDFVDRHSTPAKPKVAMFRVEINGAEAGLGTALTEVIKATAPRKEISKFSTNGTTTYTIGIFTKEEEAQALANALRKADATVAASVVQIGK